jgi:hypothetical protein
MKISCNIIADLLELYADSVVSEDTKNLVETHLSDCLTCREKLAEIKQSISIPAETIAEPLKFLSKKIRKRFVVGYVASLVLFLALFVGFRIFESSWLDDWEPPVPFEDITIYGVDVNDDIIHISQSFIYTAKTVHAVFCEDTKTAEYHFCFYGEEAKESLRTGDLTFKTYIDSAPMEIKTYDDFVISRYEVVAIYYCRDKSDNEGGGNVCRHTDTYLIWER